MLLCCFVVVLAIKRRRTTDNPTPPDMDPSERSLSEWNQFPLETLRCFCDEAHLSRSGTRAALSRRLFAFYNPRGANSETVSSERATRSATAVPQSLDTGNSSTGIEQQLLQPTPINTLAPLTTTQTSFEAVVAREVTRQLQNRGIAAHQSQARVDVLPVLQAQDTEPPQQNLHSVAVGGFDPDEQQQQQLPQGCVPTMNDITSGTGNFNLPSSTLTNQGSFSGLADNYFGASSLSPSSLKPAIPKTVHDKIKAHEYINLELILPSHSPLLEDEFTLQVSSGREPSVKLVPKYQTRQKIKDFHTWLKAFTLFARTYLVYYPHRTWELLCYQSTICNFASMFPVVSWLNYDNAFRQKLAFDRSRSWASVDEELFNAHLRVAGGNNHSPQRNSFNFSTRGPCFTCGGYGHFAQQCPSRAGVVGTPPVPPVSVPAPHVPPVVPPFRAPQRGIDTVQPRMATTPSSCQFFNAGRCQNAACRFPHVCRICRGQHAAFQCDRRYGH